VRTHAEEEDAVGFVLTANQKNIIPSALFTKLKKARQLPYMEIIFLKKQGFLKARGLF
jgi:hypothetical protein